MNIIDDIEREQMKEISEKEMFLNLVQVIQ